jgi:ribokinase
VSTAVVGHVEWVDFCVCERLPAAGEILHAREWLADAGGGGGVAAVQLTRLAPGEVTFVTSIGEGPAGEAVAQALAGHGVDVRAGAFAGPQRRAITHLTDDHERTITVLGERHEPQRSDDVGWDELARTDAVYFTGGDVGALRASRAARVLVATPRARNALTGADDVQLDVLVASRNDAAERGWAAQLTVPPRVTVLTDGGEGGTWAALDGTSGTWSAAPLPGEPVDSYGCGDTFAAVLAHGLGAGLGMDDALAWAARCGARCLTGRGPYQADLALERR